MLLMYCCTVALLLLGGWSWAAVCAWSEPSRSVRTWCSWGRVDWGRVYNILVCGTPWSCLL